LETPPLVRFALAFILSINPNSACVDLSTVAKWENRDGLFVPKQGEKRDVQTVTPSNLQSLTQYVVFLEKK